MGVKDYSTSAGNNTTISGISVAEGCPPSGINDAIRQAMADTRSFYECGGWIDWGHTCTYASGTTFTVATDVTSIYHANRRVKAVGASTGTIYGKVTGSSYSAPNTTVTVSWDSGSLANEPLTISVGFVAATGSPVAVAAASESASGVAEIATQTEVDTGTDDARFVTPLKLATWVANKLLSVARTVTSAWGYSFQSITYASSITWDVSAKPAASITLTGSPTITATNIEDGKVYQLRLTQDGTGSRVPSMNALFKYGDDGAPTYSTTASKTDYSTFVGKGTTELHHMGTKKGF